jgi:hypothetical protein
MKYNLNVIRISEAAFHRLEKEISLEPCQLELPELWGSEGFRLYSGLVPLGNDIFRKILLRASRIPQVTPQNFSLHHWTERWFYEVCSNPAVYGALDARAVAGK